MDAAAPGVRELQALVRRLDALEGMRQQERNRLAADPGSAVVCASSSISSIRWTMR